jgi:IS4 transposase
MQRVLSTTGPAQRPCIDEPVYLGKTQRVAARLLAVRVPAEVANQRRRRLRLDGQRRSQPLSARRLALADWTILITNVPPEQLSLEEALVLIRARWQIELLFKLWKSHGNIDEWRSASPGVSCVK